MRKQAIFAVVVALAMLFIVGVPSPTRVEATPSGSSNDIGLELILQAVRPTSTAVVPFGYVSYMKGFDLNNLADGALSERTALFTFYTHSVTQRTITNGPLSIVNRVGPLSIYLDTSPDGDWSRPETFMDGEQILAGEARYQVIVDNVTGAFTSNWDVKIAWSKRFSLGGISQQLGREGDNFTISLAGHNSPQAPPIPHIAGLARGLEVRK